MITELDRDIEAANLRYYAKKVMSDRINLLYCIEWV